MRRLVLLFLLAVPLSYGQGMCPTADKKQLQGEFAKPGGNSEWTPMFEEFECSGDLAFVRSTWELRVSRPDGTTAVQARNRSVDILRRTGGQWRIFRSLNYPVAGKD